MNTADSTSLHWSALFFIIWKKKCVFPCFFFNRYLWNIYNTMNTVFDFFFSYMKICCVFFSKVKTLIFYVLYIHELVLSRLFVIFVWSPDSQMSVPAAHTCFTDSNSWKVELCTMFKRRFWNQITLAFSLVRGQWDIVFICLDLVGLNYFSVLSLIS